jgi:hypothetical protein
LTFGGCSGWLEANHGTESPKWRQNTLHGKDFIPNQEEKFLAFVTIFCAAVVTHATALGIPAAMGTDITAKLAAYTAATTTCEQPNADKVDRKHRKLTRAALTIDIRFLVPRRT